MSALDPRFSPDDQRNVDREAAEARAAEWAKGYDDAFEDVLEAADEHDLDPDTVRQIWRAGLDKFLADQAPKEPRCCPCGSGTPAGQCGCDYSAPSAAERHEQAVAERARLRR